MDENKTQDTGSEKKKSGGPNILLILIILVLAVILAAVIGFAAYGDKAIKLAVEKGGSQALKVGVAVDNVSLRPLKGILEMKQLMIDNPEGFQNPRLLEMGSAYVALDTSSLLSDTVVINKMDFKQIKLTIEQKGLTSNLKEIMNNLPKPSEEKTEKEGGKELLIKELNVEEVAVTVKLLPVPGKIDNVTFKLAPIHLTDVGSEEKMDIGQLAGLLLQQITLGVIENGKGLIPTEMIGDLSKQILGLGQKTLEGGQKVIEGAGKGIIEGGKGVIEGGGKAIEGLKGLIPGKKED